MSKEKVDPNKPSLSVLFPTPLGVSKLDHAKHEKKINKTLKVVKVKNKEGILSNSKINALNGEVKDFCRLFDH